jgi:hypothetical protein
MCGTSFPTRYMTFMTVLFKNGWSLPHQIGWTTHPVSIFLIPYYIKEAHFWMFFSGPFVCHRRPDWFYCCSFRMCIDKTSRITLCEKISWIIYQLSLHLQSIYHTKHFGQWWAAYVTVVLVLSPRDVTATVIESQSNTLLTNLWWSWSQQPSVLPAMSK